MSLATLASTIGRTVRRQAGWVGVDIGSHSLKIAQLQLVKGKKKLVEAAILPLPPDARLTRESIRTGWLKRGLQQLVAQMRTVRGQTAACGLSLSVTEFRLLSIPPGSLQERREMIAQELARDGTSPAGALEFDFWSAEANPADAAGQNSVNLLTVSQDLATDVAEAMHQSKLYCETLDGGPFILARAASLAGHVDDPRHPAAVLDWGHSESQFVVAIGGQPAFSRLLKGCSLNELLASVARGLQLLPEECLHLLSKYGFPDSSRPSPTNPLQEQVSELAEPILHQLKLELGKSLAYLKHQRPHLLPAQICLVGGAASIRNIVARLNADSEIPFAVWAMDHNPAACPSSGSLGMLAQAAALSDLGWAA